MDTKYALILMDGAADEPVAELGDRTPLEVAEIPFTDTVAETGRIGTVRTVPSGFPPGSDVATMSLLGYDIQEHYTGRAPIEAVSQSIQLHSDDVVYRCNLVNITKGEMSDFTAGHIRTAEAKQIIDDLNAEFEGEGIRFHTGMSYRNLMVVRDPQLLEVSCMPPHDIQDEPVAQYLPKGKGAKRLMQIVQRANLIVAEHDVNLVRKDLGEIPATAVWLWGQGVVPIMRRFRQRFGVHGCAIAAVDLIRGLAKLLGWPIIDVPGATGYLDTDYDAKGRAAVQALNEYDMVTVHIEAPDEAGHAGDAEAKIQAIERIDEAIVGPVLRKLREFDQWRIMIAPDHPTPISVRTHTDTPPPFCMAGSDVPKGLVPVKFTERYADASDLHITKGHELMEFFLRR